MIRHILAATDLSPHGEAALGRALRLRRRLGAQLTVLYLVEDELPERIATRRAKEARELIEGQLRAGSEPPDLQASAVDIAFGAVRASWSRARSASRCEPCCGTSRSPPTG